MMETDITVYGANWCPDCRRSKLFLGEHRVPYKWVDIEQDSDAQRFVTEKNGGRRIIPTIVFRDGSFLAEPTNAELAAKLGLKTQASRTHYDLIVAGGGPAGLTAALYTAREAIDTLVIERSAFGGQTAGTEKLENMPGFPEGIEGIEFSLRLRKQAERFGVELLEAQQVDSISRLGNLHCVRTEDGQQYSARALLIATGSHYKRLNVPGEAELLGAGVHFCATCDGPFYKGKRVAVIGGGNSASEESLLLTRFAEHVTLLVRGKELSATRLIQEKVLAHGKIDVRWHTEVREFVGAGGKLTRLKLVNNLTGAEEDLPADGAFIFIGLTPNTGFLEQSGVIVDRWGFIVTGHNLLHGHGRLEAFKKRDPYMFETSVPGVFAAGDVRDASTKQAVSAAGEGAAAALTVRDYLRQV
ncbi:MAG: FAD-dependent oxidoreductase [Deltaproteobacteria bacterium]|jgi:thioredoxin reductase (NADPH)|nr:FAD-dependent oxidoreductase [Deltaproteobacteria bacterium]